MYGRRSKQEGEGEHPIFASVAINKKNKPETGLGFNKDGQCSGAHMRMPLDITLLLAVE